MRINSTFKRKGNHEPVAVNYLNELNQRNELLWNREEEKKQTTHIRTHTHIWYKKKIFKKNTHWNCCAFKHAKFLAMNLFVVDCLKLRLKTTECIEHNHYYIWVNENLKKKRKIDDCFEKRLKKETIPKAWKNVSFAKTKAHMKWKWKFCWEHFKHFKCMKRKKTKFLSFLKIWKRIKVIEERKVRRMGKREKKSKLKYATTLNSLMCNHGSHKLMQIRVRVYT